MSLHLRALSELDVDTRQKVAEIYSSYFSVDFRERMDPFITTIDWNLLYDNNLLNKFMQKVREAYSMTRPDDAVMLKRIESSGQKYAQKFKECITKEDAQYRSKPRKRVRQQNSSKLAIASSSSTSAVVTSPKQPHLNASELHTLVASPISPVSTISTVTQAATSSTAIVVDRLVSELQVNLQILGEWQNGKFAQDPFSGWKATAIKMLDAATQIHSLIADCLFAWDKRKRRLANQFEHNDEDHVAFDRVRSVYVEEVNYIENQAQATVSCLYGVLDSAACWRSYYQNYQGLQVHLQIQEVSNVEQRARQQIVELAKTTFIVWRQSEQVIKAGNKFKATVRLLVGPALRLGSVEPTVAVTMLTADMLKTSGKTPVASGRQARVQVTSCPETAPLQAVLRSTDYDVTVMRTGPAGRKDGRTTTKGSNSQQNSMLAEFCDITWKNEDKRSANKDELTVCELKYGAVFQTTLNLLGEMVTLRCWSLPLILIVHASQECKAHGTIFWDNAFSEKRREPFAAPEEVSWHKFSTKFNRWFASQTRAPGNTLAPHNIQFIQSCVVEPNSDKVTLFRFYRERLNGPIKFNFCDWIYGVRKLICEDEFLQFLWQRGAVYGFASHETGSQLLSTCPSQYAGGTMLLRFGNTPVNSKKGVAHVGLVIMISCLSPLNQIAVRSLMPATLEDLKGIADLRKRMIAEKVTRDYLFPDIDWKKTLLREFEVKHKLDQVVSDVVGDHYTKIDIGVVIPDSVFCDEPADAMSTIADFAASARASELHANSDLTEMFDEHVTISRNDLSVPFAEIQPCSGQPDLSNIQATIP